MITQGEEAFSARYAVGDIEMPSEAISAIVSDLARSHDANQFAIVPDEDILVAANDVGYCVKWKDATRVQKIREQGSAYYNFLRKSEDKEVVSVKDVEDASKAVEVLKTDPLTAPYFNDDAFGDRELLYQLQFTAVEPAFGHEFKGMLDLVIVDHDRKAIYPCDLKTTKSVYAFEESFYKYRYYIQAAMYTELLRKNIAKNRPELDGYTMMDYRFIVIDRINFKPIVFEWTPVDHVVDMYGNERESWRVLLDRLTWSLEHKDEKLPKEWHDDMEYYHLVKLKNYAQ